MLTFEDALRNVKGKSPVTCARWETGGIPEKWLKKDGGGIVVEKVVMKDGQPEKLDRRQYNPTHEDLTTDDWFVYEVDTNPHVKAMNDGVIPAPPVVEE